jgi:hypothetical protein
MHQQEFLSWSASPMQQQQQQQQEAGWKMVHTGQEQDPHGADQDASGSKTGWVACSAHPSILIKVGMFHMLKDVLQTTC